MNFTFTWILDKFGLQPKVELAPVKPARKKTVAKKVAVKKASVKKKA